MLPAARATLTGLMLAAAGLAFAQSPPPDGYIGPELGAEPVPSKSRSGGWGPGGWQGGWTFCAREGERCQVRGWGVVRYGAAGRYVYREVRNASFRCDNTLFGDPAHGREKACEVRYDEEGGWGGGETGGGWSRCAREGGVCQVQGPATVRFGADGRYYEREVRGGPVGCDVQTFGDPAPRVTKHCDVRYGHGGIGPGPGPGGGTWTACAREGGICRLPGPATVRYGANGQYTFRRFEGGSVSCDNRSFGDPAPGRSKQCEYQAEGWGGGAWSYCAEEDQFCSFRGRRAVRYAADDGREVVRSFRNGVECSNRAFGTDPAPRHKKRCYVDLR
ncbi:hypothetical protein [Silanimonas lenta]|uniref:hypothetical protein n=1 Tax=Silanimonas lenta TaxID=265429 RepID=UPI002FDFC7BC